MMAIFQQRLPTPRVSLSLALGLAAIGVWWVGHGKSYVSFSYVRPELSCLPELRVALLVHRQPVTVEHGDYLFWKPASTEALAGVKQAFVLKRVAGVPGDRLRIVDGKIFINDALVAEGLENAVLYSRRPAEFKRTEVIPPHRYFMIGTARMSNDSRYWGYLPHEAIVGKGYRIY